MKKLVLDLCAGLGGFSQAFKEDSSYDIVTIDVDRKFKPTIVADVRHLPLKDNLKPFILLASPPCEHFSLANPKFPRVGIKDAMEIVGACFEAVARLNPTFWLIENPKGRLRHLTPRKPNMTIFYSDFDLDFPCQKPTDLWGNIPIPLRKKMRRPRSKEKSLWSYIMPRSKVKRAFIPKGVSLAIKEAIEIEK